MAQAVSRRLPTAAARVRAQVWSCCGQSGTGAGFLRVLRFPLPVLIPPTPPHSSSIIWDWYNRPNSGRRTKWTQSHPTPSQETTKLELHYKSLRTVVKASPHMQTVTMGTGASQQEVLVIVMPLAALPTAPSSREVSFTHKRTEFVESTSCQSTFPTSDDTMGSGHANAL
jgi:hypothetical protein